MKCKKLLGCSLLVATSATVAQAQSLHDISNLGTQSWSQAAATGRADMLIIGDSVVEFGGHGWDQGITNDAEKTFGLAGTGLITDSGLTSQGDGFGTEGGAGSTNWTTSLSAVPTAQQGYTLRVGAPADTTAVANAASFGYRLDLVLPTSDAYDWDMYVAGGTGGGNIAAYRRIGDTNNGLYFNTLQTDASQYVPSTSTGLTKLTFSFDSNPYSQNAQEFWATGANNVSILYSRLINPTAKGVTVSTLGYGGKDTHQFYTDIWSSMSGPGRDAYLQSLVDESNSGKLNIMITEGFNDRNDTTESVHDLGLGDTAIGFTDNMSSLIGLLRSDWVAAGMAYNNLSFTLVGMYQVSGEATDGTDPLHVYAAQEMAMAEADPLISFVDLYDDAPNYATASALGYSQDGLHPTSAGAQAYSDLVFNVIAAPEPASLSLGAVSLLMLARRRKSVAE